MQGKGLEHFYIDGGYGGNQDWFFDPMMKLGGCGAETAMDSSIYFTLYRGKDLYPFDVRDLNRRDYRKFGSIMKPYLSPRRTGIDRLDIYTEGYAAYLADRGERGIAMEEFAGTESAEDAIRVIKAQIAAGLPVPMLMLQHRDKRFSDYVWHWFLLNGWCEDIKAPAPGPAGRPGVGCAASNSVSPDGEKRFYVRTVTYSEWDWFDFRDFWDTGFDRKGGLVLYRL
ncbi:MAG: hypothetical protein IJM69_08010 [Firmicutes bacterium]|nr:hypothetical protein [Bacillota bacterium]